MAINMMETLIKNMIGRLKEAGYDDPTQEDITCKYGNKVIKFRLFNEIQWGERLSNQNDAQSLATKLGFGEKADYVVTKNDVVYYVKLL